MNKTNSTNDIPLISGEGGHSHVCKACNVKYYHVHSFRNANHPQFDGQCPNEACTQYYGKEPTQRPPRPPQDGAAPPEEKESNAQRSVRIGFQDGSLLCGNFKHYRFVVVPGKKWRVPKTKLPSDILAAMMPGAKAGCPCQIAALKSAWHMNAPGVFVTDWVQPGTYFKGFGDCKDDKTPQRVMPIDFSLKPEERKYLHELHPGWMFLTVGTQFHDHPVSHASCQVATYNLFSKMRGKVIDLNGNPQAAETLNRSNDKINVLPFVNVETSRDALRSLTKWGPEMVGGKRRYVKTALRDAVRDYPEEIAGAQCVASVHSLYYYQHHELVNLLNATEGRKMQAILHRHEGERGELNFGEQRWERVHDHYGQGRDGIRQTNVLAGSKDPNEPYVHPDTAGWFNNHSWTEYRGLAQADPGNIRGSAAIPETDGRPAVPEVRAANNSLAWSVTLAGPETYHLTIVTCTAAEANLDAGWRPPAPTVIPEPNSTLAIARTGAVSIVVPGQAAEMTVIPAKYRETFALARTRMMGKARTMDKYEAHSQWVANSIKSVYQTDKTLEVDVPAMYDVAYYSYWIDRDRDMTYKSFIGKDLKKFFLASVLEVLAAKNNDDRFVRAVRLLHQHAR